MWYSTVLFQCWGAAATASWTKSPWGKITDSLQYTVLRSFDSCRWLVLETLQLCIYFKGRKNQIDGKRERYHVLIHFPNACNSQNGSWLEPVWNQELSPGLPGQMQVHAGSKSLGSLHWFLRHSKRELDQMEQPAHELGSMWDVVLHMTTLPCMSQCLPLLIIFLKNYLFGRQSDRES